jgi:hypothetical protein
MTYPLRLPVLLLLLGVCCVPHSARAGEQRLMAAYEAWEAYVFTEDNGKVCYMASQPGNAEGKYTKRGDPFALVTHRPADNTRNVFSYIAGYSYKAGSEVALKIDDQEFKLFTQGETAWAQDGETDTKIINALKAGKSMVVSGVSAKGTATKDTYSLKGVTKAYEKITKECY